MLTNWNPARMPEKDEMKLRLSTARKQLYDLQMKIKEHKIPVIVKLFFRRCLNDCSKIHNADSV